MTTNATEAKINTLVNKKKQEQLRQQKIQAERRERIKAAIQRSFATADGKFLLHYLKEECGYQKNSVHGSVESGEFLDNNTMYNEGRRDLYLSLRKLIRPEVLAAVEVYGISVDMLEENFDELFE